MTSDFAEWLEAELATRNLSPADLARMTRKDQGIFSRILNRERKPNPGTLEAIAHAFKLPPEIVFRAAGIFPPKPETDDWVEEMNHKLNLLEPATRPIAEKLINALLEENPSPARVRKPRTAKGTT